MINRILADASAIVGALNDADQHSVKASSLFRQLHKPFFTCEAVITEVMFLVRKEPSGRQRTLELIEDGILQIDFSLAAELNRVKALITTYANVPMSLADACLVRMSEMTEASLILTFDNDFSIYRRFGTKIIPVIGLDG